MYKFKKWNLKYFKLKKNFQYFKFWKNKTMLHMIILILKDIAYIYIYLNTHEIEIYIILKLTKHTLLILKNTMSNTFRSANRKIDTI